MACRSVTVIITAILLLFAVSSALAQETLNPAGEPRYGAHLLAPSFAPDPFTLEVVSGGDVDVKALKLGDNCLGFAASDPDALIELEVGIERITFLIASAEDSTLIINLPNGSWSCNDDTNGLNPALVFFNAAPGSYKIWIGSYAAETFDEAQLYVSEAGPEALPTTATGPDPTRDATYGDVTLAPFFQPAPFAVQFLGGGRSHAPDFIADPQCLGFVSEAPDYSIVLSELFETVYFAVHSPAVMTLIVNGADGSWHCAAGRNGEDPAIGFSYAAAGLYDIWVGSGEEGNYAASIFYVQEGEPHAPPEVRIDTSCPGISNTDLQLGGRAKVVVADAAMFAVPETASTVIYRPPSGTLLSLIAGPACIDEQRWWRAELGDGSRGWIADGDGRTAWLRPAS